MFNVSTGKKIKSCKSLYKKLEKLHNRMNNLTKKSLALFILEFYNLYHEAIYNHCEDISDNLDELTENELQTKLEELGINTNEYGKVNSAVVNFLEKQKKRNNK
jgi:hypothetical protein